MFRKRNVRYSGFSDYSSLKRWFFAVLVLVVIAVIWAAYFAFKSYASGGNLRANGRILANGNPLSSVSVSIGDENVVTDQNGFYYISSLDFGNTIVKATKQGFYDQEQKVFLWRKNQIISDITLEKDENFNASFSGVVVDSFDKKPIGGAVINLGRSNTVSDSRGEFSFSDMPKGNALLSISAIGYIDTEEIINVGADLDNVREFPLTHYGKISFTSARENKKNIYSINYDGENLKNLTTGVKGNCWGGKFTPDGKKLVFFSDLGEELDIWGQKTSALYFLNKNSDKPVKISRNIKIGDRFVISNDGLRVVFTGKNPDTDKSEIYVAGLGNDSEWIQLTDNDWIESNIDISPDGKWVVFGFSNEERQREIKSINVDTLEIKDITKGGDRESLITYSYDGKKILSVRNDLDFNSRIFIFDIEKGEEKNIYKTSSGIKNILWSRDSQKIVFNSTRDERTDIYSLGVDGKNEVKITQISGEYDHLFWPPMEKIIFFSIHKEDGYVLGVLDISQRKITEIQKIGDDVLSWDPQGFDTSGEEGL